MTRSIDYVLNIKVNPDEIKGPKEEIMAFEGVYYVDAMHLYLLRKIIIAHLIVFSIREQ